MLGKQWKDRFVIYRNEAGSLIQMHETDWRSWEEKMQTEYSQQEWEKLQAKWPKVAEGLTSEQARRFIALTRED